MSTAKIDYEDDWKSRLRSRLFHQFKYKPKFQAWSDMVARQAQDLEDAMQALLTIISIDDSVGAQLDNLGRLVGQPRAGADDATYRLYLKARIAARRSTGTPEAIYRVFRALFGATVGFVLTTSGIGIKAFKLFIASPLTRAQAIVGASFLRDAKESGARAVLEWQPATDVMRWDVAAHGWDTFPMGGADLA